MRFLNVNVPSLTWSELTLGSSSARISLPTLSLSVCVCACVCVCVCVCACMCVCVYLQAFQTVTFSVLRPSLI